MFVCSFVFWLQTKQGPVGSTLQYLVFTEEDVNGCLGNSVESKLKGCELSLLAWPRFGGDLMGLEGLWEEELLQCIPSVDEERREETSFIEGKVYTCNW